MDFTIGLCCANSLLFVPYPYLFEIKTMRFTCYTDIKAPIQIVVDLFKNPDNLKHWQDGFKSIEYISGAPGAEGSISKLSYDRLSLVETIIRNELPEEFKANYEHKHMVNTMSCRFKVIDVGTTRLEQEIHYTQFNGFLPKVLAKLFPGMFRKQVQKWLDQFKYFVEKQHP